jgi:hypothetical protein
MQTSGKLFKTSWDKRRRTERERTHSTYRDSPFVGLDYFTTQDWKAKRSVEETEEELASLGADGDSLLFFVWFSKIKLEKRGEPIVSSYDTKPR